MAGLLLWEIIINLFMLVLRASKSQTHTQRARESARARERAREGGRDRERERERARDGQRETERVRDGQRETEREYLHNDVATLHPCIPVSYCSAARNQLSPHQGR